MSIDPDRTVDLRLRAGTFEVRCRRDGAVAVVTLNRPARLNAISRAMLGEIQRARDLMERLLRISSPLGLYAEEFDADTDRHLGNFPQAFSHLALIEAGGRIILAERLEEIS